MKEILLALVATMGQKPEQLLLIIIVTLFLVYIARRDREFLLVMQQNTQAFSRFEKVMEKWTPDEHH